MPPASWGVHPITHSFWGAQLGIPCVGQDKITEVLAHPQWLHSGCWGQCWHTPCYSGVSKDTRPPPLLTEMIPRGRRSLWQLLRRLYGAAGGMWWEPWRVYLWVVALDCLTPPRSQLEVLWSWSRKMACTCPCARAITLGLFVLCSNTGGKQPILYSNVQQAVFPRKKKRKTNPPTRLFIISDNQLNTSPFDVFL